MIELLKRVNDITVEEFYRLCKDLGVEECRLSIMGVSDFGIFKDDDVIILDEDTLN